MAIFSANSRYAKYAKTGYAIDRRGRTVLYVGPAAVPEQPVLGEHRKKDHQRLDHLAHHYLKNATGFWRIAAVNEVIVPDALAERGTVKIPTRGSGR